MNHESELALATVIQESPSRGASVLSTVHEVPFPNGSTVALHPVREGEAVAVQLRAIHHDGHWVLFDLKQLLTRTDLGDLKAAHPRDRVGLVMHALRREFHNALQLTDKAEAKALERWAGEPRPCSKRPPAGRPVLPPLNVPTLPKRAPTAPRPMAQRARLLYAGVDLAAEPSNQVAATRDQVVAAVLKHWGAAPPEQALKPSGADAALLNGLAHEVLYGDGSAPPYMAPAGSIGRQLGKIVSDHVAATFDDNRRSAFASRHLNVVHSTGHADALQDLDGNRRFWPVKV